ncbi:hypothetical protein MBLNU230_g4963t1 [Neophaeotheca triangularis]
MLEERKLALEPIVQESLQHNARTVSNIRSLTASLFGVAAGTLGLESWPGFVFYFIGTAIVSLLIFTLKTDGKAEVYFFRPISVLEARLEQAQLLKKVVDAIKDLVQDCNFDCNDSGIALQAMDNSHVALVSMMLKSESFSPFRCDRNIALGINLVSLTKVLRAAQNDDILTLKAEDAPDVVNLQFESSESDRLSEYDIKLMDIDQEHLGIPDTEYAATISMPSAEFRRICTDLNALSESVAIECTKDGVTFKCTGDIGNGAVTLRSHTDVEKPQNNTEINLSEPVALTFSLKYLVGFCKASGLSDQVKLCLSNEVPLLVEYALSNNSYLRFYLAPKIGDDDYVGNTMATFVMQSLGCEVSAIHTVNYSNHVGYGTFSGRKSTADEISTLYAGLKTTHLDDQISMLLSGYSPSAAIVTEIGKIARELKTRNSLHPGRFFWVLDPVMGDNGRVYVDKDSVPAYKTLLRDADLILPNQFEAELLSGVQIRDLGSMARAIGVLHKEFGVPHVLITSVRLPSTGTSTPVGGEQGDLGREGKLTVVGSSATEDRGCRLFRVTVPALPVFFSGTGDMLAALTVARFRQMVMKAGVLDKASWRSSDEVGATELPLAKATEMVLASMHAVLKDTAARYEEEVEQMSQERRRSGNEGIGEEAGEDNERQRHMRLTRAAEVRVVRNVRHLRDPPELEDFRAVPVEVEVEGDIAHEPDELGVIKAGPGGEGAVHLANTD